MLRGNGEPRICARVKIGEPPRSGRWAKELVAAGTGREIEAQRFALARSKFTRKGTKGLTIGVRAQYIGRRY